MNHRKQFALLGMATCLLVGMLPQAVGAKETTFKDVKRDSWYHDAVEKMVSTGFVHGISDTHFAPKDKLTYGQAVKFAACLHKKATTGDVTFPEGGPLYSVYIEYAKANGIIKKNYNWNQPIPRGMFFDILYRALPAHGNMVDIAPLLEANPIQNGGIKDVSMAHPQSEAIYQLYRSGIIVGDENQMVKPNNLIQRSEGTAILNRILHAEDRIGSFKTVYSSFSNPEPTPSWATISAEEVAREESNTPFDAAPTPPTEARCAPDDLSSIMGEATATAEQMAAFCRKKNPNPKLMCSVEELAQLYIEEGKLEGVRGDIAFAQALLETGYFRYGGDVLPEQNNYAGIGTTGGGVKGGYFDTPRMGVQVHIQHLKAYGCTKPLSQPCVDPRFTYVSRGVAKTVYDLDGKWAMSGGYGQKIMNMYEGILNFK